MARLAAEAEARAAEIRARLRRCTVCGKTMLDWPGRTVHFYCEPNSLACKVCTCPPGCSGERWGSGVSQCSPDCEPCRIMRGKPLPKRKR
jgi:hypothetical protein